MQPNTATSFSIIPTDIVEMPLKNGMVTLVDAADLPKLVGINWNAYASGPGRPYVKGRLPDGGPQVFLHRHITGLVKGDGKVVDHANGDTLDNRRSNLRVVTQSQNLANARKRSGTRSQWKGVYWYEGKGRWYAQIRLNGKSRHLGMFDSELEAALAYDRAALEAWGPCALLNSPDAIVWDQTTDTNG